MDDPKNIHEALRRLTVLVSCIGKDAEHVLEYGSDARYIQDRATDILDYANTAQDLVVWVRSELAKTKEV